ncbi:MAG: SurA N-terminal domain-containing protein [Paludibacteraceae bacterium]|nr:SurA N-terminal domain-containing protein [Paludibacteraceae bacterium]
MATLEKIRSKGLLLLIVVGLALVVFIVGDLVNSGSTYFQENNANVAVINGNKVKIRDYAEKMDQFNDVVKLQYGNNINDEMTEQIRQMVWESTVTEKVIGDECENIGMTVTKNELADMLVGNNISPMMMGNQMFFNENGQFDVNVVKQFIAMLDSEEATQNIPYEQLRLYRNYWRYWEHAIKANRLQEKYTNLLNAALVVNSLEAKYAYDNAKVSADAVYAMKNYFAIADSTINVTDAEIKALYNKKKEQFKQKQSADVKYVVVDIKPSAEDFAEVEKWINELKAEFTATEDIAALVNSNSDVQYRAENLVKEQIDADFQEFAFAGKAGDVMGPIFVDNTYKMARIIETGIASVDSVNLSNMYLRRETAEATQALADSIMDAVKKGASFAELAKTHSLLQNAANGGEIGWVSEMGLEKKIATPAFSTPAKNMFQVKEGNDINLFYVNELGQKTTKAKVAVLARSVDATSRTHAELYNKMKQFIVDNNTIEKLEAEAANNGYVIMSAKNIDINASAINNVKKAREAVRWVFENKEGAISDIFEVENQIIAVAVDKHNKEGYRSIESVRPQLLAELRKEKKGDILVAEMNGKTMDQLTTEGFRVDTVRNINFASTYAGTIGNEPSLFARVANTEVEKESAPIKGNTGAYIFKVINKEEAAKPYNEKEEMVMLETRESYMNQYLAIEALKEAANIEDMRYKYY